MSDLKPLPLREGRVLVAGATGDLGGRVARRLLASGVPVRATGRNRDKLGALATAGAETVLVDLRDRAGMLEACEGIDQVYSGVNNVMGHGRTSPNRIDLDAHDSLCDAAAACQVRRILYVSGRGMTADSPVDFFRLKHAIEERVKQSGVPYVLLCATAFMEIWAGMLVNDVRQKGVAVLFGDGRNALNFIASDDVAEFSMRILANPEIRNEAIEIGGPSDRSFLELLSLVEQRLAVTARRRHVPLPVLRWGGQLLQPFSEKGARLMRMGYFTATGDQRFPEWHVAATRFGLSPMTLEAFVNAMPIS